MQVFIRYKLKSGEVKERSFIRPTVKDALKFFEWRYGHEVVSVRGVDARTGQEVPA